MKVPIALRIFLIGTVVLLLTAVPILFNKAYASTTIFEDNFEKGIQMPGHQWWEAIYGESQVSAGVWCMAQG